MIARLQYRLLLALMTLVVLLTAANALLTVRNYRELTRLEASGRDRDAALQALAEMLTGGER